MAEKYEKEKPKNKKSITGQGGRERPSMPKNLEESGRIWKNPGKENPKVKKRFTKKKRKNQ